MMKQYDVEKIQSRLHIDTELLEQEIIEQPNMFFYYSVECAKAKCELDRREEYEKLVRSTIIKELKNSGEKMTEKHMEAEYRTDPRHASAKQDVMEAEETYNILNAACQAFAQRRYSLDTLARYDMARRSAECDPALKEEVDNKIKRTLKSKRGE